MHRTIKTTAMLLCMVLAFLGSKAWAQKERYTHADTLQGSNTSERAWWDLVSYDLNVVVNPTDHSIKGFNRIRYRSIAISTKRMQIDLMAPLVIDSAVANGRRINFSRDGNAYELEVLHGTESLGNSANLEEITVYYHGQPMVAVSPPWKGGFIWTTDSEGKPWIAVCCQGLGSSVWFPSKDQLADEPDSASIAVTVPSGLSDVSNGRLRRVTPNSDGTNTYQWVVSNPINNYDITLNVGHYVHFSDILNGEKGILSLDYWVLASHLAKAKKQFLQVVPMLRCFEHWMGPYPFYKDGYKLVEAPYLGMEHQSAVAYGNHFQNGYLGADLSHSGWGNKFDFIIIHESAHEWFGNSITDKDPADMWIHEAFAMYAESLYTECEWGSTAGAEYLRGMRKNVLNDGPIIGEYGVNKEGSGDMYYKGANMLGTLRAIIDNDSLWRGMLRGLSQTFYHQTVTTQQIENYLSTQSGKDFSKIFDQYLRHKDLPVFEEATTSKTLKYRWVSAVKDFNMPLKVWSAVGKFEWIYPTQSWQTLKGNFPKKRFIPDPMFYIGTKNQ